MRNQLLGKDVVVKRERFDVFLDPGADLALVPPGFRAGEVGGEGGEEGVDLVEAGGGFFFYRGGEGGV